MSGVGSRRSVVRGLWLPTLLAILAGAALVSLGFWQLQRLAWKEALIAAAATRPEAAPVAAPPPAAWGEPDWDALDLTHVALPGHYLPGDAFVYTVLSDARGPLFGPGLWVMAPFQTADGWVVLVNRGFVPAAPDGRHPPVPPPPEGELVLDGLIRRPDPPGLFTPAADLSKRLWFVRDAAALAPAFALPTGARLAPFTLDAAASTTPPGGLPQAGETRRVFTNSHLQYAITWFGLAAALFGVWAVFVAARLRRR